MKDRICFLCPDNKPLSFNDYIKTNADKEEFLIYRRITEKARLCKIEWSEDFKKWDLVKLWESEDVELACCHCRRFVNKLITEKEALWTMLEWADNRKLKILKELGIINQSDLLKLKNKK